MSTSKAGRVPDYMPDLQQIAEACAKIQAGWSDQDRYKRLQGFAEAPNYELRQRSDKPVPSDGKAVAGECD